MPAILNPVITDAGLNAAINAQKNGLKLEITHVALGTGQYDPKTGAPGMTAITGFKEAVAITAGQDSGVGAFTIAVRFESWAAAAYNATEVGFYAGHPQAGGILFAVHSHASDVVVQRNALDYVASFTLQLVRVPADSVTVTVNPDGPQMLAMINLHLNATDPHSQYLRKGGDTSTGHQNGLTADFNDNSKKFATTEYALRMGVNYPPAGAIGGPGNITLTASHVGRWVAVWTNGATVTLPAASTCRIGASITVQVNAAVATLVTATGDIIMMGGNSVNRCQLARGDTVTLVRNESGVWHALFSASGVQVGSLHFFLGSTLPAGYLKPNGAEYERADFPALYAYAVSTGLVSENDWWNNALSGRFSSGSSGTKFRVPDIRGLFPRFLDEGRGMDAGRAWGSYQADSNKEHTHSATADTSGSHYHNGYTDSAGLHQHDNAMGEAFPEGARYGLYDNTKGNFGTYGSDGDNYKYNTSRDGLHTHYFETYNSGLHTHTVTVGSEGGQARPRSVAYIAGIKF